MCHCGSQFRRGASSRRCNVVDDLLERGALGEAAVAAEAEVEYPMKCTLGEAAVAAAEAAEAAFEDYHP